MLISITSLSGFLQFLCLHVLKHHFNIRLVVHPPTSSSNDLAICSMSASLHIRTGPFNFPFAWFDNKRWIDGLLHETLGIACLGGSLCHTHNLTLRLFSRTCLHTTSDDDQTRPHKKHKQHDKQHHHGVGAARPSSGVNLMNPCLPRGGRPSTYFFQCRCWSDLIDSIN